MTLVVVVAFSLTGALSPIYSNRNEETMSR